MNVIPPPRRRQANSIAAETSFRSRVAELGGTVIGDYINNRTPVHVKCAIGHARYVRPDNILVGQDFKRTKNHNEGKQQNNTPKDKRSSVFHYVNLKNGLWIDVDLITPLQNNGNHSIISLYFFHTKSAMSGYTFLPSWHPAHQEHKQDNLRNT